MRMWMVDPKIMCRQHLLGEHVEHHMFIGTLNKGVAIKGYLADNLMEPASLQARHDELVVEMERRGYNHKSPLPPSLAQLPKADFETKIDREASLAELLRRCPECAARHKEIQNAV